MIRLQEDSIKGAKTASMCPFLSESTSLFQLSAKNVNVNVELQQPFWTMRKTCVWKAHVKEGRAKRKIEPGYLITLRSRHTYQL